MQLNKIQKLRLDAKVVLPPSKSIANRLLMIQALSDTPNVLVDVPESSDVLLLQKHLSNHEGDCCFEDAGTPLRFYLAFAALKGNDGRTIDGFERLRQRPLRDLLEALESAGAVFEYLDKSYHLPLKVKKTVDTSSQVFRLKGSVSSQFISALMLIAPCFDGSVRIELTDELRSAPYVEMTARLMMQSGVKCIVQDSVIVIEPGKYRVSQFQVEADWSAAAFLYSHLAVAGEGQLSFPNLTMNSVQGDSRLYEVFKLLGLTTTVKDELVCVVAGGKCVDRIELDLKDIPDMFPALSATAVALQIPSVFTGIKNLRDKESDRIAAMHAASIGLGANFIMLNEDALQINYTGRRDETLVIQTVGDHRIAMACSVYAYIADIILDNETVVKKSFVDFWEVYARLYGNFAKEVAE